MDLMAIAFPFKDPMAIRIYGDFGIRWYGLAYAAGLLLGWYYLRRLCEDRRLWAGPSPMQPDRADDFLVWATLGTVLGGRIGFFLFYEPGQLLKNPLQFFEIWQGGMAFHGGLLGVGLAVLLFARRHGIPVRSLMDLSAAVVPFGLFFGRLANFVNAEIYGRLTDVPWAVEFPVKALLKGNLPGPRHPTQIYEALLEGVVMFILLRFFTHTPALVDVARPDNRRFPDGLRCVPHLRRVLQGMGYGRVFHDAVFLRRGGLFLADDRLRSLSGRDSQKDTRGGW